MLKVKDKFQDYINHNLSKENLNILILLNQIIFYSIFFIYYYFGKIEYYQSIAKYIILFFILRYTFSYITNYTKNNIDSTNKNKDTLYFVLNSKIAIFSIITLFLFQHNSKISIIIIVLYTILNSSVKYGYTSDNFITIIIIYWLFSLPFKL